MFELILAAAAAAAVAAPPAPRAAPPPNLCVPAEACRYIGEFPLKDKQGALHRVTVRQWVPYLANGRLTLFPGEVVSLTVSDKGPVVTAATVLTAEDRDKSVEALVEATQKRALETGKEGFTPVANLQPAGTFAAGKDSLRIAFLQTDGGDMVLRVANGYERVAAYRAFIVTPGRDGQAPTSVCAVPAGKFGVETWPPPLIAIQVADLELQAADSKVACR